MIKKLVLVTGATGQQGGAVARSLLAKGHGVRALCRNPDSPKAITLKELGAEIVTGDYNDRTSLERAAEGTDTVFALATPFVGGVDMETRQGIAIADAAKAVGTEHLVYSSVSDADRKTGVPHFDSKFKVEKHIESLDIPYTIIAPVYFIDNLFLPQIFDGLKSGMFMQAMLADRKLKMIAVENIGQFAELVIDRCEAFLGTRINIASDELTGTEIAAVLSGVLTRHIEYAEIPLEKVRAQSEDMATMYDWFNRVGYSPDIDQLRNEYPEVGWQTMEQWVQKQDWSALKVETHAIL